MSWPASLESMSIATRLAAIEARINAACAEHGRPRASVRLLPISKTQPADAIRQAYAAGYREFGESRVQEAAAKASALADLPDVRWTMIGHLQTNKARALVEVCGQFQALDSLKLAAELDRRFAEAGRSLEVMIEVNTSGEASKFGLDPDAVVAFARELRSFQALRPVGLMTIAARTTDRAVVAGCFARLADLRDRCRDAVGGGYDELSMGMSGDFELAIAHGATCLRVGTAVFGERSYPTA